MFRIEHIEYLLLLVALPLLAWGFWWFMNRQKREWEAFAQNRRSESFLSGRLPQLSWSQFTVVGIVYCLAVFSLCNPQFTSEAQEVEIESSDVFVALDISYSMLGNDMKPNRLTRAKNLAQQTVEALEGNRVGLILFAGEAYMFMPLTSDISSAINFIQAANVNMAPTQGTAIAAAIDLSMQSFDADTETGKSIVIISDGEDHEQAIDDAVSRAKDENVFIFTVAVGTDAGAYLPGVGRDNYLFGEDGKPVVSRVNEAMLREIANDTGASAFNLSKERNIDQAIANNVSQMEKQVSEVARFTSYDSIFQYFLLPLLVLVLWQFLKPIWSYYRTSKIDKQTV